MKSKDKESNCSSQYITSSLFSTEVDFIIVRDAESKNMSRKIWEQHKENLLEKQRRYFNEISK